MFIDFNLYVLSNNESENSNIYSIRLECTSLLNVLIPKFSPSYQVHYVLWYRLTLIQLASVPFISLILFTPPNSKHESGILGLLLICFLTNSLNFSFSFSVDL